MSLNQISWRNRGIENNYRGHCVRDHAREKNRGESGRSNMLPFRFCGWEKPKNLAPMKSEKQLIDFYKVFLEINYQTPLVKTLILFESGESTCHKKLQTQLYDVCFSLLFLLYLIVYILFMQVVILYLSLVRDPWTNDSLLVISVTFFHQTKHSKCKILFYADTCILFHMRLVCSK